MRSEQEEKVLEVFEYNELYEINLDAMFLEVMDCNITMEMMSHQLDSMSVVNYRIAKGVKNLTDTIAEKEQKIKKLNNNLTEEKEKAAKLERKKLIWKVIAVVEGAVLVVVGGVIILITIIL